MPIVANVDPPTSDARVFWSPNHAPIPIPPINTAKTDTKMPNRAAWGIVIISTSLLPYLKLQR